MATGTLISEAEYFGTSYEPDCEFEDGVLIERNAGTPKHSKVQSALAAYFFKRRNNWNIHVYTEVRYRIRRGKYMMPDLAIVRDAEPEGEFLTVPPLIWIEILSPEDRHVRVNRKVKEVLDFGAPYVWVIDPETMESELHTPAGHDTLMDGTLRIADAGIVVPLADIFED